MSFADAQQALEGAMEQDFGGDAPAPAPAIEQAPAVTPATPEGQTAPVQPHHAQSQLRDPSTGKFILPDGSFSDTPAPVENTASNLFEGSVNPDTLPVELQPLAKQLQAAFTRKTQDLAAQRTQLESLGSFDELSQAAELYRNLQDPGYLQAFHSELSSALEAQGLSPGQARAEAARHIEGSTAPTQSLSESLARLKDDPELAPVANTLEALQSRLDQFESNARAQAESQQLAQQQLALARHIQNEEMAIRSANPTYGQNDIDAIYELSAFHDGSLAEAQARYEQIRTGLIETYLAGKSAPVAAGPVQGSGVSEIPSAPTDLDAAFKAAMGHLEASGIDTLA